MTNRIIVLFESQELRNEFGTQAAEIAKKEFSLDRMIANYLDLYEELINAPND